jgi:uncharacterized protein YyaL (SSP411 family)
LANSLIGTFSNTITKAPHGYSQMLIGLDFMLGPTYEVVIAGEAERSDTHNMIKELGNKFIPNKIILLNSSKEISSEIYEVASYVRDQGMIDNKATAYVCTNFACGKPTNDVKEMLNKLQ